MGPMRVREAKRLNNPMIGQDFPFFVVHVFRWQVVPYLPKKNCVMLQESLEILTTTNLAVQLSCMQENSNNNAKAEACMRCANYHI